MKKIVALLLMIILLIPTVALAKGGTVVTFDDPVLEAALREAVGIPEGDVTDKDLAKITNFGIGRDYEQNPDPTTQVHSLTVLQYCTKLNTLQLNFHNISDISPLANLKKLKTLELGGNPIADITPLTKLTALETLALYNCQAQDYTPLANLKKLKTLYLDYSTIADLAPLAKMTKLNTLSLVQTAVTDVTPLAKLTSLRTLYLKDCAIVDYSPLSKVYGKLKEKDFNLTDATAAPREVVAFDDPVLETAIRQQLNKPDGDVYTYELAGLTYVGTGFDYEREPPEGSRVKSIEVLRYCVNLEGLELSFNQITDISPIAGLTKLTNLGVGGNPIADIAPLAGLTQLKSLALFNCQAKDYTPLSNLTGLTDLSLDYATISDLTPLSGLTALYQLSLSSTPVTDVTPLAGLTNLRKLYLSKCIITDYSPLSAILPNLTETDFDPEKVLTIVAFNDPVLESIIRSAANVPEGNVTEQQATQITELGFERFDDRPANEDIFDLSALTYCTGLRQLTLNNIAATDLSALASLTELEGLTLRNSEASDYSMLAELSNLNWLDLTGSAITDLAPLAGLTKMQALTLCYTNVSNLTPLAGLTNLFGLKLEGSPIADYSPVAALYPNLGKCDFIIPEAGVVRFCDALLEERVRAAMDKPTGDITPEEAAVVTTLDLSQDKSSESSIAILQGLEAFTGLTELNLSGNRQLGDLWPLSKLTGLTTLSFCWCNVTDISPLANLTNLQVIVFGWGNRVENLDAIAGLNQLQAIDAKDAGIRDVSGLEGLPALFEVQLCDNQITDVASFAKIPQLRVLLLKNNPITDYGPIETLLPNLDTDIEVSEDSPVAVSDGTTRESDSGGWQYDASTCTLTIESDAAMVAYKPDQENIDAATQTNAPWSAYLSQMEQIIVGDDVTQISDYAFAYASALKKITIGSKVASLGERCLYKCGNWQEGVELEIIVNCSSMPVLGMDTMGYTWDNQHAVVFVPASQLDQWLTEIGGTALKFVAN